MLNMLKYQFYRLSRSISTYIGLALIVIFDVMIVGMNASLPGAQSGEDALSNFMTAAQMASFSFAAMAVPMVYSAWVVIYAYGEFQQGYIRNIAPSVKNKCSFFFSHLIVCAIMFVVYAIFSCAVTIICSKLMVPDIQTGDFLILAKTLLMYFLLHITYAALALLAVYFFRNIFIPLIVTFSVSMGIETIPIVIVQNLIDHTMGDKAEEINSWLNHLSISINLYSVEYCFISGNEREDIGKIIIMSGIVLILYSVLACLSITKKDIK